MQNKSYSFPVVFWGEEKSTKVTFNISEKPPKEQSAITSVMCAVFKDNKILLVKPKRGWGLPGGHIEKNESPQDALKRECLEEADAEIKNIKLIGYWETNKIIELESNRQYPDRGYQLLFMADLEKLHSFKKRFEVDARRFASPEEIAALHHNYANVEEIFRYILDVKLANIRT